MKTYLVSYRVGKTIQTTQIKVKDEYVPSSDNMMTIKEAVIEKEKPNWVLLYASPFSGNINESKGDKITKHELDIVAISNLDI